MGYGNPLKRFRTFISSAGHCWSSSVRVCTMPPDDEEELELAVEVFVEIGEELALVVEDADEEKED